MAFAKDRPSKLTRRQKILIIGGVMVIFILLALFTDVFQTRQAGAMPALIWMLGLAVIIAALVTLVTKTSRLVDAAQQRDSRLEQLEGSLEKIREELGQITQNSRLSESARQIAFRDNDRRAIRDAVFDKLQQQDFENTYRIISEMEALPGFKDLAGQLRLQADNYRGATAKERINQLIGHIERLFEDHQWAKASTQIERLIQTDPKNEMAQQMRQKLVEKKEERKKVLLQAWDDAIKRQATDRSIEILKDLDMYLTPNEALALQEAARDVFRTKLHNLGVQFSLAISDKQWAAALQTGQQIIHNFPNSRMAEEIAGRMEILKRRVEQQL